MLDLVISVLLDVGGQSFLQFAVVGDFLQEGGEGSDGSVEVGVVVVLLKSFPEGCEAGLFGDLGG